MKKLGIIFICMMCVVGSIGCGKKADTNDATNKKVESSDTTDTDTQTSEKDQEKVDEADKTNETDKVGAGATAADSVEEDVQNGDKQVYYSNDNADGYESEEIQGDVTPESLMQILIDKNVVTPDVTVLSCNETTVNGEKALDLDLSRAFLTVLANSGVTGESVTVGSVCNTFLSGYGCSKIKITVEGEPLITEHAEYTDYMSAY